MAAEGKVELGSKWRALKKYFPKEPVGTVERSTFSVDGVEYFRISGLDKLKGGMLVLSETKLRERFVPVED